MSRRKALALLGRGRRERARRRRAPVAQPAVRRKVKLTYWNWADNPTPPEDLARQRRHVQQVAELHRGRGRRHHGGDGVAQEAGRRLRGRRRARRHHDGAVLGAGLFRQRHPRIRSSDWFNKWDAKSDFFPNVVEQVRSKPGQPVLYLPQTSIPYLPVLSRRLAEGGRRRAARHLRPVRRRRQGDHQGAGPLRLRHARADLFGDPGDPADLGERRRASSPTRRAMSISTPRPRSTITEKWVGMYTKDKSAQPTAVNDGYREQYALMEKSRCGFWFYGPHASPALMAALGDAIQGLPNPRVGAEALHAGQSRRPDDDDVVQGEGGGLGVHALHRLGRRRDALHGEPRGAAGAQVGVAASDVPEQPLHQARPRRSPTPGGRRPTSSRTGPTSRTRSRRSGRRRCARRSR